jgi:transposase InsO family protein
MTDMRRQAVSSSTIASIGYEREEHVLEIEFLNGSVCRSAAILHAVITWTKALSDMAAVAGHEVVDAGVAGGVRGRVFRRQDEKRPSTSSAEQEDPSVSHRNAPLSVEGRRRLVDRCQHRPIAHVAAEMGISRQCASKWVNRYRQYGELGLRDRCSTPHRQPTAAPAEVVADIESMRREHKWSASRIAFELEAQGSPVSRRTVTRHLARLGLHRRRFIDPTGASNRAPRTITACRPGHMIHLDVKKVGRIPDGGGWRAHGRGSDQAKAVQRSKNSGVKAGYVYLHSAVDGYSRLAYTEALPDEKAATAIGFTHRAKAFFAAHGITRIERIVTDNGSCYRAADFATVLDGARHQRITPYTPRHNGKVERYNRILAEEFLYARTWTSEQHRTDALTVWNIHYNYHRPHTAAGNQPPATQLHTGVTNVTASYN